MDAVYGQCSDSEKHFDVFADDTQGERKGSLAELLDYASAPEA